MKTAVNSKQSQQWFLDRVGQWIYRAPIFVSEMNRPFIAMRIKDQTHARLLFDLQRNDRPGYVDNERDVVKA